MVGQTFSSQSSNQRTALDRLFELAGGVLDVQDPGGQSGSLSGHLIWAGRQQILDSFRRPYDPSHSRHGGGGVRPDEAKRLWRLILGDSFTA
jgi:hypothetical protein